MASISFYYGLISIVMNEDIYYKAMLSRDYRFDGKFFIGVKTTGIYCRPICPAKPKRKNVEFFSNASGAENAGYRPCMRCRPECAPFSPAWYGTSAIVQRALKVISSDGYFSQSEDDFAKKFGVTARHLRRLFKDEVGQTPKQIAYNNRLDFSRRLICESNLAITTIAMNSGFSSLRRFNDAFKKRFHKKPSEFRKSKNKNNKKGVIFSLSYRPPFDWQNLLDFYKCHHIAGVEIVTDKSYERIFRSNNKVGYIKANNNESQSRFEFQIITEDTASLFSITQKLRQMFDLDSDPIIVENSFQSNKLLDRLWKKYPGLRIARCWDPFEASICTILGQLVSLEQARSLVTQLIENYGEPVIHPVTGVQVNLFPTADTLVNSDLKLVRTTQKRKNTIREFSKSIQEKKIELNAYQDLDKLKEQLLAIPGIGPWTVEYITLRAIGDTDAFPGTDLILKRAMEKHKDLDLETVRPWRSYAAVYLWKHYAKTLSKKKGERL